MSDAASAQCSIAKTRTCMFQSWHCRGEETVGSFSFTETHFQKDDSDCKPIHFQAGSSETMSSKCTFI